MPTKYIPMDKLRADLQAVVRAGEAAGYWTRCPSKNDVFDPDDKDRSTWAAHANVLNPAGLRFELFGRHDEDKAFAKPDVLTEGGLRVTPVGTARAGASWSRGPEAVAQSLHRNLTSHTTGVKVATATRDELEKRKRMRKALLAHVAKALKLGFTHHGRDKDVPTDRYWDASLYHGKLGSVSLDADGGMRIERSFSITIDKASALIAIVKD